MLTEEGLSVPSVYNYIIDIICIIYIVYITCIVYIIYIN